MFIILFCSDVLHVYSASMSSQEALTHTHTHTARMLMVCVCVCESAELAQCTVPKAVHIIIPLKLVHVVVVA